MGDSSRLLCLSCGERDSGEFCSYCGSELEIAAEQVPTLFEILLRKVGYEDLLERDASALIPRRLHHQIKGLRRIYNEFGNTTVQYVLILAGEDSEQLEGLSKRLLRRAADYSKERYIRFLTVDCINFDLRPQAKSSLVFNDSRLKWFGLGRTSIRTVSIGLDDPAQIPRIVSREQLKRAVRQYRQPPQEAELTKDNPAGVVVGALVDFGRAIPLVMMPQSFARKIRRGEVDSKVGAAIVCSSVAIASLLNYLFKINLYPTIGAPVLDEIIVLAFLVVFSSLCLAPIHGILNPKLPKERRVKFPDALLYLVISFSVLYPTEVFLNILLIKIDLKTLLELSRNPKTHLIFAYPAFGLGELYRQSYLRIGCVLLAIGFLLIICTYLLGALLGYGQT